MPQAVISKATALAVLETVNLLQESGHFAIDIGGSLAKLLYVQRSDSRKSLAIDRLERNWPGAALSVPIPEVKVTLHFFAVETRNMSDFLKVFRTQWATTVEDSDPRRPLEVRATGGGAIKYAQLFRDELHVQLHHLDEMTCLVRGLNFLLTKVKNEVYLFDHEPVLAATMSAPASPQVFPQSHSCRKFVQSSSNPFPYLLVNIGSGVSILKVSGVGDFERVSGSSLGGGTFWGLCRMLTNCKTFDEVVELTMSGDNSKVDMLVGDIYGGEYKKIGLDSSVIAASFGKVTMKKEALSATAADAWKQFVRAMKGSASLWLNFLLSMPIVGHMLRWFDFDKLRSEQVANIGLRSAFSANDVALSLLRMVAFNIGQIAFLNAKRFNIPNIYFGGNFIRDHPYTLASISFAVRFWSEGEYKALFLQHDGFLGVIGAYLGSENYINLSKPETQAHESDLNEEANASASNDDEANESSAAIEAVNGKKKRRRGARRPRTANSKAPTMNGTTNTEWPSPSCVEEHRMHVPVEKPKEAGTATNHDEDEGTLQIDRRRAGMEVEAVQDRPWTTVQGRRRKPP